MTYFEAVGYYGLMVYGIYDQVAIQASMWHILELDGSIDRGGEGCLYLKGNRSL